MPDLFSPLTLRGVTFPNRIFVSPMCQYSAIDGLPQPWHHVHLGSRAVGGAALVMAEATAVCSEGRITLGDTGMWADGHAEAFVPTVRFIRDQGAVPGLQLAHAGRKGSAQPPWHGGKPLPAALGGWEPVAPSPLPFDEGWPEPRQMTAEEIGALPALFAAAARRAQAAGFQVLELHMAHGYLLHQFLSPLSNRRSDEHGGPLENRARLPLAVAEAVRRAWPEDRPLFVRISATDWTDGGWDLEQSVRFAAWLKERGVDLVDCSSGGLLPRAAVPVGPGYQVPFAEEVRRRCAIATAAVGMITEPAQAQRIVSSGQADAVLLARQLLREPYWPLRAARELGVQVPWPVQYERARP